MSTRALQIDILLLGFRDPDTDSPLSGGVVNFFDAGTSNPATVWDEKEKTNARTSVTLDSNGQAQVYGDGVYKLEILDVDSVAVSYSPLDNIKIRAVSTNVVETNTTYTATTDDDLILGDTSGGGLTINLYPSADFISTLSIKNISSDGNAITVDATGSELIDGLATQDLADDQSQAYYSNSANWFGAGISTGTTYTSVTLVSGTNNSFDEVSGVTTVNVPDASNTVKGAIEIATDAEAVTGTAELLAINPLQLKTAVGVSPFTKEYISTGQTITSAGQLILPHSLGVEPKFVTYVLQCTTDEFNYSIGDRIVVDTGNGARFNTPTIDATNITLRYSNSAESFNAGNKTTGGQALLTNTSWQLYVSAWA